MDGTTSVLNNGTCFYLRYQWMAQYCAVFIIIDVLLFEVSVDGIML